MDNQHINSDWIDLYLRRHLTAEQEAEFETALLDSVELQAELEAAMALQLLLRHPNGVGENHQLAVGYAARKQSWQPLALAASLALAVFSTTMFWHTSIELDGLESELDKLSQPYSSVLTVPLDIMRSSDTSEPDVIVQKPDGNALIILEIEVSQSVRTLSPVYLALRDLENNLLLTWSAERQDGERLVTAIRSSTLPTGKAWLEISNAKGSLLDRRLLEFR